MSWESATAGDHVCKAWLVELELASETIRVHDGVGVLSWGGHEWSGVGDLGAVSGISGGVDLDAADAQLGLTGIPSEFRDEVLNEVARGSPVNVYEGLIDKQSGAWSYEPELIYTGFVDAPEITESISDDMGAYLTVLVPVISAASYARRLTIWRRTDADQQRLFAGDEFFSFKTDLRIPVPTPGAVPNISGFNRRPIFPRAN